MNRILSFIIIVLVFASCNNLPNKNSEKNKSGIRIISLVPSVTQELVDLGMEECIVGATSYCIVSATNKSLIVGSVIDVNIEKVLLLKPDIVFASGLTKQNDINALKSNNIKVHMLEKMHSYGEICNHFIEVGKLVGKAGLAQDIVNKSKSRVDSLINTIVVRHDSLTLFFQIGAKPIFTVIPNTFMNDYITLAGCKNIFADLTKGTVTRESVLQRNPDIIIIATMGGMGDNEKNIWEGYSELTAVKNNAIFIIDSKTASLPTVLTFTEALEQVIGFVYLKVTCKYDEENSYNYYSA